MIRFREVTSLRPDAAADLTDDQVKYIGLSGQKARYLRDLAEHFVQDAAIFDHLESLSDDEVAAELTKVKGIGVWTAQMFLMFTLARPDVFAPDDLGLQNAIMKVYDLPERPTRAAAIERSELWRPYRTIACYHLWRTLDGAPTVN
jgi:DNA-3-methyladenine glycosylase II